MQTNHKDIREPKEYFADTKKGVMEDGTTFMEVEIPDVQKMKEEADAGEFSEEVPIKVLRLYNSIKPQRLPYESSEEYKIRRGLEHRASKARKKGRVLWPSRIYGTATIEKATEINAEIEAIRLKKNQENTNQEEKEEDNE